ncbi:MAG TPA: adenylate kinase [Oligoflexia bacterium]|nr:adenylate kinase [Oligoflexia bacterium]HMP26478.1 adenylate kinase [Oligoflexia bacterium]
MRVIFIGPPCSGKGTQAKLLSQKLSLPHIATGEIFAGAIAKKTPLGLQIQELISKGLLVDNQTTNKIVAERLNDPDCQAGFILDGYPRNLDQALFLNNLLSAKGLGLDRAIYLKVPEEILLMRVKERAATGRHSGNQRLDDNVDILKERIAIFNKETAPLIQYFKDFGILVEVNGVGLIDEVTQRIFLATNP